ncbi:hypothetical protein D0962_00815 [Leptolyngbyaceae cyanobacterium CCMR0082]|uniref:Uncharacterized protein n=1 Tax=Adonisia turfae CCMR0082 TaxID=2304604 RepID=A0A6M0RYN5_9CYAN|nr:hypothetical protein [Adonisia turfae]NEZ61325.1 hypothetical protein [Adonisia turfae CCMR0082]
MKSSSFSNRLADTAKSRSYQQTPATFTKNRIQAAFMAMAQTVAQFLHDQVSTEPLVSEHQDRNGERYYRIYDPLDEKMHYFSSKNEVRIWLDQRHYR